MWASGIIAKIVPWWCQLPTLPPPLLWWYSRSEAVLLWKSCYQNWLPGFKSSSPGEIKKGAKTNRINIFCYPRPANPKIWVLARKRKVLRTILALCVKHSIFANRAQIDLAFTQNSSSRSHEHSKSHQDHFRIDSRTQNHPCNIAWHRTRATRRRYNF